jgi:V8-like Glu-specific endopeptidase
MKSFPLMLMLSLVALAGCAKDKSKDAKPTSPAAALSSNDQCAMMDCQKVKTPATSSASETSTDTDTSTDVSPAQPDAPVPPPSRPVVKPAPINTVDPLFLEAQKIVQNVQLTCRNGDCDPSVGLLTVTLKNEGDWNVGQCTASLIGTDLIVTNGHCIPQDLEANGSDCTNRMWLTFADQTGHPEFDRQVGCSQVLFRRKDGGMDGADYAYIKLARAVNRPVVRQTQAGFENSKLYHLHKINPSRLSEGMAGQMQKVDCRSMYESAIFSQRLDAQSQTSFLVDCSVLKGNSGSPVFDDAGDVRGVVYAFVDKDVISKVLAKNGSKVPTIENIADVNVASNFACLTLPGDPEGRNLPASCADQLEHLGRRRSQEQAALAKILKPAVTQILATKAVGHADILGFGWTIATTTSEALGTVGQGLPDCVKRATQANFLGKDLKIRRPFFYVRATYDKYLRATNQSLVWAGFAKTAETMHLAKADASTYQLDINDSASGQVEFNGSLVSCQ